MILSLLKIVLLHRNQSTAGIINQNDKEPPKGTHSHPFFALHGCHVSYAVRFFVSLLSERRKRRLLLKASSFGNGDHVKVVGEQLLGPTNLHHNRPSPKRSIRFRSHKLHASLVLLYEKTTKRHRHTATLPPNIK
jgi:hypothetical protein